MTFICMKKKLRAELIFIYMKGFALVLALKKRHNRTRKWPIQRQNKLFGTTFHLGFEILSYTPYCKIAAIWYSLVVLQNSPCFLVLKLEIQKNIFP